MHLLCHPAHHSMQFRHITHPMCKGLLKCLYFSQKAWICCEPIPILSIRGAFFSTRGSLSITASIRPKTSWSTYWAAILAFFLLSIMNHRVQLVRGKLCRCSHIYGDSRRFTHRLYHALRERFLRVDEQPSPSSSSSSSSSYPDMLSSGLVNTEPVPPFCQCLWGLAWKQGGGLG